MKNQLAKLMFLNNLSVMKSILDLLEFKMGKKSDEYLYMKKQLMDYFYNSLKKSFLSLEEEKLIKRCPNKCSLRNGYSDCKYNCGGSGFINNE